MTTLETGRLLLRDFTADDFESFYATSNDPEYQRFYSEEETTREFWTGLFERILVEAARADRSRFQLAICLPSGALIGTCGVRIESADQRQGSFGCAIARSCWGLGYAQEASRRVLGFGFESLGLQRIYAETIGENARARALAERLGMRLEGVLWQHRWFRDRWWDTALYALLEEEWRRSGG